MKSELIAIPLFDDNVPHLLDVAEKFMIYEIADRNITQRAIININNTSGTERIHKLRDIGVSTIISGGASRHLSCLIADSGIKHIPWESGPMNEIIASYINNTLVAENTTEYSRGKIFKNMSKNIKFMQRKERNYNEEDQ